METVAISISLMIIHFHLLTLATGLSAHFLPKMLINFMKMRTENFTDFFLMVGWRHC